MPPPTYCISMRCVPDSMRCWRARRAASWRVPALISCRHAHCLILRAGRSKTSSRISVYSPGGRVLGDSEIAVSTGTGLTSFASDRQGTSLARDIAVGRRVINAEIQGLEQLGRTLDNGFAGVFDFSAPLQRGLIVTRNVEDGHGARTIAGT